MWCLILSPVFKLGKEVGLSSLLFLELRLTLLLEVAFRLFKGLATSVFLLDGVELLFVCLIYLLRALCCLWETDSFSVICNNFLGISEMNREGAEGSAPPQKFLLKDLLK